MQRLRPTPVRRALLPPGVLFQWLFIDLKALGIGQDVAVPASQ